jgi:hypothetical protein
MELTFEQQIIIAVLGGVVASVVTSILTNGLSYFILRAQWKREKEERLEQWRREQEARRREWKRQYREELLRPFLEKVDRIVALAGFFKFRGRRISGKSSSGIQELAEELAKEIFSARALGIGDRAFRESVDEFMRVVYSLLEASVEDLGAEKLREQYMQLQLIADRLHKRAEELMEETFD